MGHSNLMSTEPTTRQDQILQAAARCFVAEGFHGASMARIAKSARMSPGHIYHYFSSKTEIISEIVRREESAAIAFFEHFAGCGRDDLILELTNCTQDGVKGNTDLFHSVLTLEVLAEAARNDAVLGIVQAADREIRERFASLLRDVLGFEDAHGRVEVLFALFSGLAIRVIRNPDIDRTSIADHMVTAMHAILAPTTGADGVVTSA